MEDEWKGKLEDLQTRKNRILAMGGERAVEAQHKEGKLTARERIEYFFDPGTFTEIGGFVKNRTVDFGMDKKDVPAEGVVTGYGRVNGRLVMTAAEDYTSMAGTFGEYHAKKYSQAIDTARDMGIPFISMNDSGGARLQEGIDTLQGYAWLFQSQILASGVIPQVSLLLGPCLGGQAYHPVMQDFVIQARETGFMGIAGPAFVKTQTGEDIDLASLCGWKAHAVKAGQTHVVGEGDKDCLDRTKELLAFLPQNNTEKPPRLEPNDDPERTDPNLFSLVPANQSTPYDMHKVIKTIVDDGNFFELLPEFAKNILIGFARMAGRPVGVVASQPSWAGGTIDCDAADKAARFIRFCDLFNLPLVNLHDTPGYMIGSREDWKGILRHGSKMLFAFIDATVPKVTVILRKSYAGAYLGMCDKGTGADFVFAWPIARVTIVGAESAASVIFAKEIRSAENPDEARKARIQEYRDKFENPYKAAERGYIDDVIDPADTRKMVNRALDLLETKTVVRPWRKYSNITL